MVVRPLCFCNIMYEHPVGVERYSWEWSGTRESGAVLVGVAAAGVPPHPPPVLSTPGCCLRRWMIGDPRDDDYEYNHIA